MLVGRRRSEESALQGKEIKNRGRQAAQRVLEDSCEVKISEGFAWTIALGLTSAAPKACATAPASRCLMSYHIAYVEGYQSQIPPHL